MFPQRFLLESRPQGSFLNLCNRQKWKVRLLALLMLLNDVAHSCHPSSPSVGLFKTYIYNHNCLVVQSIEEAWLSSQSMCWNWHWLQDVFLWPETVGSIYRTHTSMPLNGLCNYVLPGLSRCCKKSCWRLWLCYECTLWLLFFFFTSFSEVLQLFAAYLTGIWLACINVSPSEWFPFM